MIFVSLVLLTGLAKAECDLTSLSMICRPFQMKFNIAMCLGKCDLFQAF